MNQKKEILVADVAILEPFVSSSGNPENGDYEAWSVYVKRIEGMSLVEVDIQYTVASARFSADTVQAIESNPRVVAGDTPHVAHAKRLYAHYVQLRSGVRFEADGSMYYRV